MSENEKYLNREIGANEAKEGKQRRG